MIQPVQVEPLVEPGPVEPNLDRSESAHLQELGSLGSLGSVYEDAKESKREAPDEEEEGDWKNHKALEALRTTKLAPMVQQFFDGKAGADALAGAVAAHYRDGRWEEWREPTVRALTVLEEEEEE